MKKFGTFWFIIGQHGTMAWVLNDEKTGAHFGTQSRAEATRRLAATCGKYPENTYTVEGIIVEVDTDELV